MRALCHLAERYGAGPVQVRAIAEGEEIPGKFLEGILLELKRAGLVLSRRGNEGGYALAREPGDIALGEVLRVLDGPIAPMATAAELKELMDHAPRRRGIYAVLVEVRDATAEILDRTTLADVLRRNRPTEGD